MGAGEIWAAGNPVALSMPKQIKSKLYIISIHYDDSTVQIIRCTKTYTQTVQAVKTVKSCIVLFLSSES